jgi:acetoin:2,6-dichlorophenolindophenol oxidoreductase subunit beta
MPVQTYAEALVDALYDSLAADPRVSLIGSYVLGLGPQRQLMDRVRTDFPDRIVDPPTAEAGAAATGVGAAMAGLRPFVDLGTGSFSYLAWSQIVNEAAVSYYMSDGRIPVPVTFHLLHGVRGAGAPQHSHSPQAMLCNAPGVCAENFIRIDLVRESLNVGCDGRAAMFPFEAVGFAVQVEQPT